MGELEQAAVEAGKAASAQKDAKNEYEAKRSAFFKEITLHLSGTGTFAQTTVPYSDQSLVPDKFVETYHPGWTLVSEGEDGLLIEEDPAKTKFSVTVDDITYVRNVVERAPSLDDERLRSEAPDLWERITEPARVLKNPEQWNAEDSEAAADYFVPGKLELKLETKSSA